MRSGKSESQAIAESRTRTYADEHAASWQARFYHGRSAEPKSLAGFVKELRDAYALECPSRLHSRDTDAGGTPAFAPEFERWLATPFSRDDSGADQTPVRATLAGMAQARDLRSQSRARIAYAVIVGGLQATEAAARDGVPAMWADIVAFDTLRVVWRRLHSTTWGMGGKTEAA